MSMSLVKKDYHIFMRAEHVDSFVMSGDFFLGIFYYVLFAHKYQKHVIVAGSRSCLACNQWQNG